MRETPLISVIIPTYNRGDIVLRTVQSVLDQTYQNMEVWVIDDGSTDGTEDQIKKVNDTRLQYIKTSNQKQAAARNEGLKRARGDYIVFCDSDDQYFPDSVAYLLEQIQHKQSEWVYGHLYFEDIDKTVKCHAPQDVMYGSGHSTCGMMIKNKPYLKFDPDLHCFEDWFFAMEMSHKMTMQQCDRAIIKCCKTRPDKVTEKSEDKFEYYYEHVALKYMKKYQHGDDAAILVVINTVDQNPSRVFWVLNQLRLFMDKKFNVVFNLEQCPDAEEKAAIIKTMGYPCYKTKSAMMAGIKDRPEPYILNMIETVLPLKGFRMPEKIEKGVQYKILATIFSDQKKATVFQTIWRPNPIIITAYKGPQSDKNNEWVAVCCDKDTFRNENATQIKEVSPACVWVPALIKTIYA